MADNKLVKDSSMDDLLNEVKVTKEKKKNGKEKVFFPCKEKTVDDLVKLKTERTDLDASIAKIEYELEKDVGERREKDGKAGKYLQTYHLQGTNQSIRVTFSDRFSKIGEENVGDLKQLCKDNDLDFAAFFSTKESLVTKTTAFTKENLNKMLDSFKKTFGKEGGVEFFKTMFEYVNAVSPAKGFDEMQFGLEDNVREEITTSFTKQAKASVVTK